MTDTTDWTLPSNQVRLLIADTDPDNQLIDDPQILGYLALEQQSVKRAAADALYAIAASEVLVSKKIRTQDLSTDGPAVATALRAQADGLRAQADDDDDLSTVPVISDFDPYPCPPELTQWPCPPGWPY